MTRRAGRAMLTALAVTIAACGTGEGVSSGPRPAPAPPTQVRVQNHDWQDMNVYLLRDGMRVRLGTVTSMATQVFRLTPSMVGGAGFFQLIADPIGANETYLSESVGVWPGQTVECMIQKMSISILSIRR